jgi:hypothetical protein
MDDWKYTVSVITRKENGKDVENASRWPKLFRENAKTKAKEFYWYDNKNGITTRYRGDGIAIKEYEFLNKGPLFRKIRKIEQTHKGSTTVTERYSYDENGVLLKSIFTDLETKGVIEQTYNNKGQPLQILVNGAVAQIYRYDQDGKLLLEKSTAIFTGKNGKGIPFEKLEIPDL